ncbi:helix-turn-helix domain-containing protein [Leifsonia shinshuensis]|uniref:Helix-turn-helix transcriptional regulator n=1 Tax=Leifsonia shinshuensis TaxID=150026 RepID=A0A7G6YAA4_9MICO|nr:helix-turn-helix transcriptional regulator [Leifsonia shinshuensis]QNE35419.1 helix-turn-helix transcriptional regulator [Leifsonia shinshuensis]
MPRLKRQRPREIVDDWPRSPSSRIDDAKWEKVPDKPLDERLIGPAHAARQFASNLREAIEGFTMRDVAELCQLDHGQIVRILNGDVWPDIVTITLLEDGLGVDLFPRRSER